MQLKNRRNAALREIGTPLAAATCALLGQSAPGVVQAQELMPWDIDTSMLIYSESDGRVQDLSLNVWGRKELREDKFLGLTLAIDSLTGASPSGAMPANVVQTFTSPSGNSQYTVAPGDQALDTSFLDTRTAISASWEMPVARLGLLSVGANLSDEYDYTSTGVNARYARDFNNPTLLSFGSAHERHGQSRRQQLIPFARCSWRSQEQGRRPVEERHGLADRPHASAEPTHDPQINYSLSRADGSARIRTSCCGRRPVTGPVTGPPGGRRFGYLFDRPARATSRASMRS
jgi:hypothetical protein